MRESIQKAIEGGYDESKRLNALGILKSTEAVCLDKNFWVCLGKALGWGNALWIGEIKRLRSDKQAIETHELTLAYWEYHWHRLIYWIADRKNIDDFFKQLLSNK